MSFHVDSEVGQLRQVIVHKPGLELTRLTPQNVDDLLFDDVMWAQRAREEHDAFVMKLEAKGVKVYLFHDLLAQALDAPGAREFVQDELTTATRFGPALDAPLDELVAQTPADAAAAARTLGGPVALKAIVPGLVHKSDAGAVCLGLRGPALVEYVEGYRQRAGVRSGIVAVGGRAAVEEASGNEKVGS